MSDCSDGAQKVETENVVDTIKETSSTPTEQVVEDDQEYFDNSFDIFNVDRILMTNQALQQVSIYRGVHHRLHQHYLQVEQLLSQLQECERLYPSTRHLVSTNSAWDEKKFQNRSNHICLLKSYLDLFVFH